MDRGRTKRSKWKIKRAGKEYRTDTGGVGVPEMRSTTKRDGEGDRRPRENEEFRVETVAGVSGRSEGHSGRVVIVKGQRSEVSWTVVGVRTKGQVNEQTRG